MSRAILFSLFVSVGGLSQHSSACDFGLVDKIDGVEQFALTGAKRENLKVTLTGSKTSFIIRSDGSVVKLGQSLVEQENKNSEKYARRKKMLADHVAKMKKDPAYKKAALVKSFPDPRGLSSAPVDYETYLTHKLALEHVERKSVKWKMQDKEYSKLAARKDSEFSEEIRGHESIVAAIKAQAKCESTDLRFAANPDAGLPRKLTPDGKAFTYWNEGTSLSSPNTKDAFGRGAGTLGEDEARHEPELFLTERNSHR